MGWEMHEIRWALRHYDDGVIVYGIFIDQQTDELVLIIQPRGESKREIRIPH